MLEKPLPILLVLSFKIIVFIDVDAATITSLFYHLLQEFYS
jgi:hypothetical protein